MRNNRPIRTRPWRKPPWRRRRSGFWFVPPTGDGGFDDAKASCWADTDTSFSLSSSTTTPGGPALLNIPILWNLTETLNPRDAAGLPDGTTSVARYRAYPWAEKWRLERIVGDVMIIGRRVDEGADNCITTGPMLVNFSFQHNPSLGDAPIIYSPAENDGALGKHWFHERRVFLSPSGTICTKCDGETGTGSNQTAKQDGNVYTYYTLTGVPSAKVVHFDLRPKLRVGPESFVSLIMTGSGPCAEDNFVGVLPKLKAYLSRSG